MASAAMAALDQRLLLRQLCVRFVAACGELADARWVMLHVQLVASCLSVE